MLKTVSSYMRGLAFDYECILMAHWLVYNGLFIWILIGLNHICMVWILVIYTISWCTDFCKGGKGWKILVDISKRLILSNETYMLFYIVIPTVQHIWHIYSQVSLTLPNQFWCSVTEILLSFCYHLGIIWTFLKYPLPCQQVHCLAKVHHLSTAYITVSLSITSLISPVS